MQQISDTELVKISRKVSKNAGRIPFKNHEAGEEDISVSFSGGRAGNIGAIAARVSRKMGMPSFSEANEKEEEDEEERDTFDDESQLSVEVDPDSEYTKDLMNNEILKHKRARNKGKRLPMAAFFHTGTQTSEPYPTENIVYQPPPLKTQLSLLGGGKGKGRPQSQGSFSENVNEQGSDGEQSHGDRVNKSFVGRLRSGTKIMEFAPESKANPRVSPLVLSQPFLGYIRQHEKILGREVGIMKVAIREFKGFYDTVPHSNVGLYVKPPPDPPGAAYYRDVISKLGNVKTLVDDSSWLFDPDMFIHKMAMTNLVTDLTNRREFSGSWQALLLRADGSVDLDMELTPWSKEEQDSATGGARKPSSAALSRQASQVQNNNNTANNNRSKMPPRPSTASTISRPSITTGGETKSPVHFDDTLTSHDVVGEIVDEVVNEVGKEVEDGTDNAESVANANIERIEEETQPSTQEQQIVPTPHQPVIDLAAAVRTAQLESA
eukprot:gene30536-37773_t